MLRRFLTAVLIVVAAAGVVVVGAQTGDAEAVRRLTDEGARAYKDGRFDEARQLFERALELDPESALLPVFVARSVHQLYKPRLDTPENRARAEEAVKAYMRVMDSPRVDERARDDAYNAVAYLYRQTGETEKEEAWLRARADDASAPPAKRADAFTLLASRRWNCSYDITEQKENKRTEEDGGKVLVRYLKPKAPGLFDKALSCVTEGLDFTWQALALNTSNANAWAYKTNLLRERAKLAEMDEDAAAKAEYDRQAAAAEMEFTRLREAEEEARRRAAETLRAGPVGPINPKVGPSDDAAGERPPTPTRTTPRPLRTTVSAGVLNGKVIHKTAPVYPREAKEAGASGMVTVRVVVDEEGKVTSATAERGHPLLREAAVAAVRQWVFSRTLLSGRPVIITGVVILSFQLD
jgi:TonB family protein